MGPGAAGHYFVHYIDTIQWVTEPIPVMLKQFLGSFLDGPFMKVFRVYSRICFHSISFVFFIGVGDKGTLYRGTCSFTWN